MLDANCPHDVQIRNPIKLVAAETIYHWLTEVRPRVLRQVAA